MFCAESMAVSQIISQNDIYLDQKIFSYTGTINISYLIEKSGHTQSHLSLFSSFFALYNYMFDPNFTHIKYTLVIRIGAE